MKRKRDTEEKGKREWHEGTVSLSPAPIAPRRVSLCFVFQLRLRVPSRDADGFCTSDCRHRATAGIEPVPLSLLSRVPVSFGVMSALQTWWLGVWSFPQLGDLPPWKDEILSMAA